MDTMLSTLLQMTDEWTRNMNRGLGILAVGVVVVFINMALLMVILKVVGSILGAKFKADAPKGKQNKSV